jgi:hypothetical protein
MMRSKVEHPKWEKLAHRGQAFHGGLIMKVSPLRNSGRCLTNLSLLTLKDQKSLTSGYIAQAATSLVHGSPGKAVLGARIPKSSGRMMLAVIAQGHHCQDLTEATLALKNPREVDHTVTSARSRRVWTS